MIPLPSQCLVILQAWKKEGWEHISDYLFTRHGFPWKTSGSVSDRVRQIGNKLGIKGLSAHRFRHSFAVALLNYGILESALQKLMGHACCVTASPLGKRISPGSNRCTSAS
jgi:integrase